MKEKTITAVDLLPCPFCGGKADFERHGSHLQSSIISCENCGARLESNEAGMFEGMSWNHRSSGKFIVPTNRDTPYLQKIMVLSEEVYNPDFGDGRMCACGHVYGRHFDGYEDNENVGCKYQNDCGCRGFSEKR